MDTIELRVTMNLLYLLFRADSYSCTFICLYCMFNASLVLLPLLILLHPCVSCSVFSCGPLASEKAFTCSLIASPSTSSCTKVHLHCSPQPSCSHGRSNTSKAQRAIVKPSTATSISSASVTGPPDTAICL